MLFYIFKNLVVIVLVIVAAAYTVLLERKLLAYLQLRNGPNQLGIAGMLQPWADAIKLIGKKSANFISINNHFGFLAAPILFFGLSMTLWLIITQDEIEYSLLWILLISSLLVYIMVLAGLFSGSKYSILAASRAVIQMLSYEIGFGLMIINVMLLNKSLSLREIANYQESNGMNLWPLFPCAIYGFVVLLAESKRAPFDLVEAESELVSGYNVEYFGLGAALFLLSEYANLIFNCLLFSWLFLSGGWWCGTWSWLFLSFKTFILVSISILIRGVCLRYRFDHLLTLGWTWVIYVMLSNILITALWQFVHVSKV